MRNSQEVALFADVNNLFQSSIKKYNRRLDYKKYMEFIKNEYGVVRVAYAYGFSTGSNVEGFKSLLRHSDYECRWADRKTDWSVAISMDVVRQLDKSDLIILGSGSPTLAPCAEYVKQQGIKVYCLAIEICKAMKNSVDRWIELPEELLINDTADKS